MKLTLLSREGNLARLACEGEITPGSGPGALNPIEEQLGVGCYGYKVLINMEKASYINSAGVGWLVGCHRNFEKAGGRLVLHSIPPMINHVLQLLKMNKFLHCAADEQQAMQLLTGADS